MLFTSLSSNDFAFYLLKVPSKCIPYTEQFGVIEFEEKELVNGIEKQASVMLGIDGIQIERFLSL